MNSVNTKGTELVSIDEEMLDGVAGGGLILGAIHGAVQTAKTVVSTAENVVENGVTITIPGLKSIFGGG
jgi:hypothetical protein